MTGDALKLTIYFGERDRAGSRFLADALCGLAQRRGFATSVMLRGIEGFGFKHHLHTGRLLTLSEDLPLVFVAVDVPEQIEATVPEVRELMGDGLISLERARFSTGPGDAAGARLGEDAVRLTLYAGRAEQAGRRPAYIAAVEALRRAGMAGASAIPAVDGTLRGERRRARFFSSNAQVPMMLLAVGSREAARRPWSRSAICSPHPCPRLRTCGCASGRASPWPSRLLSPSATPPGCPSGRR